MEINENKEINWIDLKIGRSN